MVSELQAQAALEAALRGGADFAELFFEECDETQLRFENRAPQGLVSVRVAGVGLQLLRGARSVYVHSSDRSPAALMELARRASELAEGFGGGKPGQASSLVFAPAQNQNAAAARLAGGGQAGRVGLLREMDRAARGAGVGIRRLAADCFAARQRILVANSEGLYTGEERATARVRLQVTVEEEGLLLSDWEDYARPGTFETFPGADFFAAFARDAVKRTRDRMKADRAPSCRVPVVLEAEDCGTLWHESCGHALEAGAVSAGNSVFAGRIGEKVASERVTLIDDGTIPGLYGSSGIDDEGHPRGRNVLIENGVLKGFLCSRLEGRLIGRESNGCGRRQHYSFAPASRMGNTFLAAGTDDEEEMVRSLPEGLYVAKIGGGTGGLQFSLEVKEGYWIRNGQIGSQVRGLMLTGNGLDVIKKVDRVGRRLVYEHSGSFCGAASGLIPVTSSQPRVRISEMAVSGG